ncbi:MAG TPA: dihydroneopterin aldolase [Pseudogracilibacillus sp.]|nr:dihydroneopterin aldolase [Pseudogracilibacillus sp.]
MDKIIVKKMEFYGYHGLFPEEKKLGQRFFVDVHLFVPLKQAGLSDKMEDSIDYSEVYTIVKRIVEGESKNLIEAVAEEIAKTLLQTFSSLHACKVKVTKPDPPIDGNYESVEVQIYRERER